MSISTTNITTTALTTTYTSAGADDSVVSFMSLCNYGGAAVQVAVHVVASGDSATDANLIATNLEIIAGDTYSLFEGRERLILGTSDAIIVVSTIGTVSAVTSYYAGV